MWNLIVVGGGWGGKVGGSAGLDSRLACEGPAENPLPGLLALDGASWQQLADSCS